MFDLEVVFNLTQIQVANAELSGFLAPALGGLQWIGHVGWPVHQKHRLAIHAYISRVAKNMRKPANMVQIVFRAVCLRHQHLFLAAVPNSCPIVIGPTEAKWKIWRAKLENFVDREFQQPGPAEPVVVIAEAVDAILGRKGSLSSSRLGQPKIIETEIGGQMRLVVSTKTRTRLDDVRPLGKTLPPPLVVV